MSKKFGKILLGMAAAGAAGAGVYYWLKKKDAAEPEEEFSDDFEEDDFDLDDDLGEAPAHSERGYVPLTPSSEAKEEESVPQDTPPVEEKLETEDTAETEEKPE